MSAMPVDRSELIEVQYRRISRAGLAANLTLVVLGVAFLLPMLWMFFASVDSDPDWAIKLPHHLTGEHFHAVVAGGALHSFRNSLYLAFGLSIGW